MIEVYYWPTPNGHKIGIALEEMALPHELRPVNIGAGDQFKPEFLALSPNGRIPAILDPDGPGGQPVSIFESGAILQYLGRKTGQLYGSDLRTQIQVEEWLHWQVGGLGPMSGQANHFRNYAPNMVKDQRELTYGRDRYSNEVRRLYGVLDTRLGAREFLAGDYSIADIASWSWVLRWEKMGVVLEEFPSLKDWYDRIEAREAVQRAVARGEALRTGPELSAPGNEADAARSILFGQRPR